MPHGAGEAPKRCTRWYAPSSGGNHTSGHREVPKRHLGAFILCERALVLGCFRTESRLDIGNLLHTILAGGREAWLNVFGGMHGVQQSRRKLQNHISVHFLCVSRPLLSKYHLEL